MSTARPYHAPAEGRHLFLACVLAGAGLLVPALGGCVSVPLSGLDGGEIPIVTGSLGNTVEIVEPLPGTLAYSDAVVIGEVTARSMLATVSGDGVEWTNRETGSAGTWVPLSEATSTGEGTCRTFGSTVNSVKGVHRYSGRGCQRKDGRVTLRSLSGTGDAAG